MWLETERSIHGKGYNDYNVPQAIATNCVVENYKAYREKAQQIDLVVQKIVEIVADHPSLNIDGVKEESEQQRVQMLAEMCVWSPELEACNFLNNYALFDPETKLFNQNAINKGLQNLYKKSQLCSAVSDAFDRISTTRAFMDDPVGFIGSWKQKHRLNDSPTDSDRKVYKRLSSIDDNCFSTPGSFYIRDLTNV